jgi:hypothetical protein
MFMRLRQPHRPRPKTQKFLRRFLKSGHFLTRYFPFPNTTTLSTFSENGNWSIGVAFSTL